MESFPLFVLGTFLTGVYAGFAQYYRFAAADAASPDSKSKAISFVVAGGVLAAFAAPELVAYSNGLISSASYAGPYLFVAILTLGSIALLLLLE